MCCGCVCKQASSILHPILQMGWVPLCEVHCNGLTGLFLGGHDRDLYIRVGRQSSMPCINGRLQSGRCAVDLFGTALPY